MLEPDRNQIEIFVDALFRHAGNKNFVAVRSFFEAENKVFRRSVAGLSGGLRFLTDVAEDDARRAAQNPVPVVFCPPIAVFKNKDQAREDDIELGLTLSVDCDTHPNEGRAKLEGLLGPGTIVVKSGSTWVNGGSKPEDKLHTHWRLAVPAQGKPTLAKLKQARELAARIAGADTACAPVCHPFRWPGSWHRKGTPRLCEIEQTNPDVEIDLASALAVLTAAAPEPPKGNAAPADTWRRLVIDGVSAGERNQAAAKLAGHLLRRFVDPHVVLELVTVWNEARCRPPLPANEIITTVNSIARRELARRQAR